MGDTAFRNPFQAFTSRFPGITDSLITPATVSKAYDPADPPKVLPDATKIDALWDTGATSTVISSRFAEILQLDLINVIEMHHAGGKGMSNVYIINLGLPNGVSFFGVPVAEAELNGCDMLIGMDIICRGDFSLTNHEGCSCFTFRIPSIAHVDYVKEHHSILKNTIPRNTDCPCGRLKANGEPIKFKNCCGK